MSEANPDEVSKDDEKHPMTCFETVKEDGTSTENKITDSVVDAETDAGSESFNPLHVLYAKDISISKKPPNVQYQNIAAFESALKRYGVWGLQQKPNKSGGDTASGSKAQKTIVSEEQTTRRFLPHQMPIKAPTGSGIKQRHFKNLWKEMNKMQGPLRALSDSVRMQRKVRVLVRNEHGTRGCIEGNVICFDKHWNILLRNVEEVWRRRKFKYGVNKMCEADNPAEDCTQRLTELGITLPQQTVKSLNRKNVEVTRYLEQLMVRGEQIILVNIITTETLKSERLL